MGSVSNKYTEGTMKGVSGKVDSGTAMGDKQIPPNIGSGGATDPKQKVDSPLNSSKDQIPPMKASPKGPPIAD